MWALIGLVVGALVGNWLWRDWGAAIGGIAGFLIGAKLGRVRSKPSSMSAPETGSAPIPPAAERTRRDTPSNDADRTLRSRVDALELRIGILEQQAKAEDHTAMRASPPDLPQAWSRVEPTAPIELAGGASDRPEVLVEPTAPTELAPDASDRPGVPIDPIAPIELAPDAFDRPGGGRGAGLDAGAERSRPGGTRVEPPPLGTAANPLWTWFTSGNALTRLGVVVLLFGVAFLLKYFAEHFTVPIELRLAAVAAGGFALIGIGMWLVASRPGYGLALQGAGSGILYLTTYAAFELYGVLSAAPAVVLLVAVTGLTVFLALRNDSQPLAGLAIAGGFLAPVLVNADSGPVLLFGYFALLNAAIFVIAWSKAWRGLNVIGFVFTFVLGILWGDEYYQPELYATVEPFLVLFFVFYVAIAILYARRGPVTLKDPVDGLLVFGVPIVGFALQTVLVRDTRYGAAWSAVTLAATYAVLFVALRKRSDPGVPLLSRAFLALAVIFVTIAIPLALDKRATAALWAVEAAGVYWIGTRQRARVTRGFALMIELVAALVFVASGVGDAHEPLFANAFFTGALLIALSALVTAWIADSAPTALGTGEAALIPLLFGWGVAWWLAAGGMELAAKVPRDQAAHAILAWTLAGAALALAMTRKLGWPRLAAASIALLPMMVVAAIDDLRVARTTLGTYGWLLWPLAWLIQAGMLWTAGTLRAKTDSAQRASGYEGSLRMAHVVSALFLTAQLAWEASEWAGRWSSPRTVWTACAAAAPAILYLGLIVRLRNHDRWRAWRYSDAYAVPAGGAIAILLTLWFFVVNLLSPGDASPLPYAPILNPLDLTLALALAAVALWAATHAKLSERVRYRWIGAALFVALNGMVLRTAHHWGPIRWQFSALLASKPLQAALTLTWTVTALAVMVAATKRRIRPLWMLGAALLAAVVVKLFAVDLGALSGLPRVIAFLGTGLLLLVIQYVSPLPPAATGDSGRDEQRHARL